MQFLKKLVTRSGYTPETNLCSLWLWEPINGHGFSTDVCYSYSHLHKANDFVVLRVVSAVWWYHSSKPRSFKAAAGQSKNQTKNLAQFLYIHM